MFVTSTGWANGLFKLPMLILNRNESSSSPLYLWSLHIISCACVRSFRFCWSFQDFELVKSASFIFAADVIYSDDLTIALFSMLKRLMSLGCDKVLLYITYWKLLKATNHIYIYKYVNWQVLYLGLEKRYNFSLDDLNVVANGYACFRRYIKEDALCKIYWLPVCFNVC